MLPDSQPDLLIKPAATTVLWRQGAAETEVLMGQRGVNAAFMPSKFVFPGGAVDLDDAVPPSKQMLQQDCAYRLGLWCPPDAPLPDTIATAALRELWEETGLRLQVSDQSDFQFQFIFRAITPPGRSRRFDARFFLVDAASVIGDPNDFSAASDELSHLHWIGLSQARSLDLPFITEVVLAEIGHILRGPSYTAGVPFFDNSGPVPTFRRLA